MIFRLRSFREIDTLSGQRYPHARRPLVEAAAHHYRRSPELGEALALD